MEIAVLPWRCSEDILKMKGFESRMKQRSIVICFTFCVCVCLSPHQCVPVGSKSRWLLLSDHWVHIYWIQLYSMFFFLATCLFIYVFAATLNSHSFRAVSVVSWNGKEQCESSGPAECKKTPTVIHITRFITCLKAIITQAGHSAHRTHGSKKRATRSPTWNTKWKSMNDIWG